MTEELLTESEETVETEVEPIDMFAEEDEVDTPQSDEDSPEESESIEPMEMPSEDLDVLYKTQMSDDTTLLDKPILIKINGKVTKIDNINDLKNLSERGLSATQKMQGIAEERKRLQFLDDNGITEDDLNSLLAGKGISEPITQDETAVQVEEVAQTILDSDYASDFKSTADMLPEDIRAEMGKNPKLLNDFYGDIQSGLAQQILPTLAEVMNIKNVSFFEAYGMVGDRLAKDDSGIELKKQTLRSQPKPNSQSLDSNNVDIWSMDDAAFNKYMDG